MKNRAAVLITLTLTVLFAAGCMSHRMMMSDRSMIASDGTMMMMNADGTSRPMTDQEMTAHVAMMMNDARFASMMPGECKMTMPMMSGSSMPGMMVTNSDGTTRAMTDSEMRAHMDMMMKNAQMSQMMMSKCQGM